MMGFQINNKSYYSKIFKEGTIIHGFNVLYNVRSQYMIKSRTEMFCQAVKKIELKPILE